MNNHIKTITTAIYLGLLFSCSRTNDKKMLGNISGIKIDTEKATHNPVSLDEHKYSTHHKPSVKLKIKPYLILMYALGFLTDNASAQCCKCFQNRTELQSAVNTYLYTPSPIPCPSPSPSPAPIAFDDIVAHMAVSQTGVWAM